MLSNDNSNKSIEDFKSLSKDYRKFMQVTDAQSNAVPTYANMSLDEYVMLLDKESVAAIEYIELLNKDAELDALQEAVIDNCDGCGCECAQVDDCIEITYESHYGENEI